MATIQIPIKVYENNTTEPMPEYMKLTISECSELPCKLTSSNSHNELINLQVYTPPLHAYNTYEPAN